MTTEPHFIDAINTAAEGEWQANALMFADWLTERGDDRGKHLRVMVEQGRHPNVMNYPDDGGRYVEACFVWTPPVHPPHPFDTTYATRWEALAHYIRVVKPAELNS